MTNSPLCLTCVQNPPVLNSGLQIWNLNVFGKSATWFSDTSWLIIIPVRTSIIHPHSSQPQPKHLNSERVFLFHFLLLEHPKSSLVVPELGLSSVFEGYQSDGGGMEEETRSVNASSWVAACPTSAPVAPQPLNHQDRYPIRFLTIGTSMSVEISTKISKEIYPLRYPPKTPSICSSMFHLCPNCPTTKERAPD